MNMVIRGTCSTGEFYHSLKGCQLCSLIQSSYQEILCPCEPFRDAVIGCKPSAIGNNICRLRSDALVECARRGYTSSRAPSTTADAGSTAAPSVASAHNSSTATYAGESVQPRPTTASSIANPSSSASPDAIHLLAFSVGVGLTFLVLFMITGAVLYCLIWQRRTLRRPRVKFNVDEREAPDISTKLIGLDSAANRLSVNSAVTPQVVSVSVKAPNVDPNPPCVVRNYHVVVKDSHFTQVGSGNIITVGERVASAIGSAHDSDTEDEEQVLCSGGLDSSGDVNFVTVSSSLSRLTSGGEFALYQPAQGYVTDLREEGYACPNNAEKCDTSEMLAENFDSSGFSANHSDNEQRRSSQASLEPAEIGFVPPRNSIAGFLERSEELSGSRHCGYSATIDNSHMPTENADWLSQAMAVSAEPPPASLPAEGTEINSGSKSLYSPPYGKECHTPSVSSQSAQSSPSMPNSGHDSVDCVGDEESLPVHPPALHSVSAGKPDVLASLSELLTGEAVPNLDYDVNLPTPSTDNLPLLSVIGNRA